MVPSPRNAPPEIVQSRSKHLSEHYQYEQYGRPQPDLSTVQPPSEHPSVPVLLCHTCSSCGRMRSNGYHRNHPVIPGKPLVLSECRKCRKKGAYRSHSYTRIRSCTADRPCDWPNDSVRVDMEYANRRGRQREREENYIYRHGRSRPRIIRQESGEANIGLRVLQQERSPHRVYKNETRVRVSSLSPGRSSRYDGVWPPPDIVRPGTSRPDRASSIYPRKSHTASTDEVWPPPDVVFTHNYRKASRSPLRRQSSRIVELSPSPPPVRRESTRVAYRSESRNRSTRSVSPPRIGVRDARRSEDAEARMMSHPRPYRPVVPEHRNLGRLSDETSSHAESVPERYGSSSDRGGILKSARGDHETARRRMSMRESQQSTTVEVGGPRVHFGSERATQPVADSRSRSQYAQSRSVREEPERYHNYSRNRYVEERPTAPPLDEMERLHIRRSSPSPLRSHEEELRADRARRLSPSPPPSNPYDSIRSPRRSPLPSKPTENLYPPSPVPECRSPSGYRYVRRSRSLTPPRRASRNVVAEDVTDSDSAHSGEITEVRSWRGLDENGKPATFVEERRSVRMIEQGNERDARDFRSLGERAAARSWRDV